MHWTLLYFFKDLDTIYDIIDRSGYQEDWQQKDGY